MFYFLNNVHFLIISFFCSCFGFFNVYMFCVCACVCLYFSESVSNSLSFKCSFDGNVKSTKIWLFQFFVYPFITRQLYLAVRAIPSEPNSYICPRLSYFYHKYSCKQVFRCDFPYATWNCKQREKKNEKSNKAIEFLCHTTFISDAKRLNRLFVFLAHGI